MTMQPTSAPSGIAPGQQVLTGTQIPIDAEMIRSSQFQDWLAYQQFIDDAAYRKAQLQQQASAAAAAGRSASEQLALNREIANADMAMRKAIAEQQFQIDRARLGVEEAGLLFQQRMADAQGAYMQHAAGMDTANFGLAQNQFNAQQRQFKAQAEQNVLQMLADRSGPQDWVAYNRLLNGLNAENPQASTTIDPFSRLEGLYEESNLVAPAAPEWQSVAGPANTGGSVQGTSLPSASFGGGKISGATSGTGTVSASGTGRQTGPGTGLSVPRTQLNLNQVGAGFTMNDAQSAVQKQKQQQASLVGAAGGHMGDASKPILVGDNQKGTDKPASKPTGHEELIINLNPEPDDKFLILSNPETREMLSDTSLVPRAAKGGTFGAAPGLPAKSRPAPPPPMSPTMPANADTSKPALTNVTTGYMGGQQTQMGQTRDGNWVSVADHYAPAPRPAAPPPPAAPPAAQPVTTIQDVMARNQHLFRAPYRNTGGQSRYSLVASSPDRAAWDINRNATPNPNRGTPPSQIWLQRARAAMQRAATGGTYGTALNDNTVTLNTYSPDQLGSQPFIQKLTGQRPSREFGGFGAALSNLELGINDMPFNINLKNYANLLPTEQAQTLDLYGRGLAVDPNDVLESARRAAPAGARFGPTTYGG